ncbi:Ig-like domain-containing protein [Erwinia sp. Leaf53]|uniref:Ig-like domain-containing protein n=1 Tax=Erwinia sp. Leaf53 TaxID=1736225 RepID=UPI00210080F0|nr:Ig-like domain-containing protein [Erwinia sp. Leaf53]
MTTPDAPTNLALTANGITLTGRGEAGDTVIVKNAAGTTLGTALVLADERSGRYRHREERSRHHAGHRAGAG